MSFGVTYVTAVIRGSTFVTPSLSLPPYFSDYLHLSLFLYQTHAPINIYDYYSQLFPKWKLQMIAVFFLAGATESKQFIKFSAVVALFLLPVKFHYLYTPYLQSKKPWIRTCYSLNVQFHK